MADYREDKSGEFWWCNSHRRSATHILKYDDGREAHHCDPRLGGIMLPCVCVNLTHEVEVVGE